MSQHSYAVREIWQKDERTLGIGWTDGIETFFDVVDLRRKCPCAVCVDEMTGKRKIKDSDIPDSIRPEQINSVGRYAVSIRFSDSHKTGIYTFDLLRSIAAGQAH